MREREPERFRQEVRAHLAALGRTQRELARALGLHPDVLSHKLRGRDGATLTQADVTGIVVALAHWGALATREDARTLLALMAAPPHALPAAAWAALPLAALAPDETASSDDRPVAPAPPSSASAPSASATTSPRPARSDLTPFPIPAPLTPLIGRVAERAAVHAALAAARLVTLTGVGGTGKTRLALQVAREAADDARFPDGVAVVDLAPLRDPTLLAPTLARALGLPEQPALSPEAQLGRALRDRQALLVVDNLEHLLEEAPLLGRLLAAAPRLRVLATSRVLLRLYGEHEVRVPPLPLPAPAPLGDARTGVDGADGARGAPDPAESEAVQLFVARARAVSPGFAPTGATLAAVSAICAALDGLPLAIELAAARVRLFPPEALLPRLRTRLTLLTDGSRDRPERQRTMRAALDWSYALLTPEERALFARLGVFAGPFDAAAAAAVCVPADGADNAADDATDDARATDSLWRPGVGEDASADGDDAALDPAADHMLGRLTALADQSLLEVAPGPTPRFRVLETVRAYALARLAAEGAQEAVQGRRLRYYLALAEEAALRLSGPDAALWAARLERAHDNLRAALEWALDGDELAAGFRLAGALWPFWQRHSHLSEGRRWLERLLAADGARAVAPELRATVLTGAAWLAHEQDDVARAEALSEEGLQLYRALGQTGRVAEVLGHRGIMARARGQVARAATLLEESLALHRAVGDRGAIAYALFRLGIPVRDRGDDARATALYEESLALYRRLDDRGGVALALLGLGDVARDRGDPGAVEAACGESLRLGQEMGRAWVVGFALHNLALAASLRGDYARADGLVERALALFRAHGIQGGMAELMLSRGKLECDRGDVRRAHAALIEGLTLGWPTCTWSLTVASLEELARVAVADGQAAVAARRCAAASAWRGAMGVPLPPYRRAAYEAALAAARRALGAGAFAAEWAAGARLPLEQAVAEVLART